MADIKEEDLTIEVHRGTSGAGMTVPTLDVIVRVTHATGFSATAVARSALRAKALALTGLHAMLEGII